MGFFIEDFRNLLSYFFKEENIKAVNVYPPKTYQTAQTQLPIIRETKEKLLANQQYEELARIRDSEKRSLYVVQIFEDLKNENMLATFSYGQDGLNLIIAEGEYDYTIDAVRKLGLKA